MTGARRLVALDLDGTLLDSVPSLVAGVNACWETLGFPEVRPEQIREIIGLPWERGVEMLMPDAGPREVEMLKSYQAEISRGERPRPATPPERLFPGASAFLDRLEAEGYLLALVTSRSSRRIKEILSRTGLEGRFVSVQTADLGPGKPDPFLLGRAMHEAGAGAAETVMVGDTTYDVETAVNAGTAALGVAWGVHDAARLRSAGARHVAVEFRDLPALVAEAVAA